ncbi:restless-like transposase [Ilyonectria robusta]
MASSDSCLITPHLTPSPTPSPAPSTPNPFSRPTEIPSEDEEDTKQRFGIISVAGHSPNEAEKLVLGPGLLDMTSKRTSSAELQQTAFDQSPDPKVKTKKPLDVVLDNDTRWLSQLYMIRRALQLRDYIELLIARYRVEFEQQHKTKRRTTKQSAKLPYICEPEHQLSDRGWDVLGIFAQLLGYFECTIKMLEGDGQIRKRKRGWMESYGNIWDVVQGFEFLLDKLEGYKTMAKHFPDPEHFRININLGWEKLDKYYQLLSETSIYYAGLALHPAYRWKWFDRKWVGNPEWIRQAKRIVHDVWHYEYRETSLPRMAVDGEKPAPKRRKTYSNPFQEYLEENRCAAPATQGDDSLEPFEDEYQHWISNHESGDAQTHPLIHYIHSTSTVASNGSTTLTSFVD